MNEITAMKYPLIRAHALVAYATLRNPWARMEIDDLGYIAQESRRRLDATTRKGNR